MITADFNIYDLVLGMRKQRPSLVQTKVIFATLALVTQLNQQSHISESISRQMLPCVNTPC